MIVVAIKILADWLPETLKIYTMATSTEMMKDRSVIENVTQGMKKEKNDRHYRVFQAMRLMRQEYLKVLFNDSSSERSADTYGDEADDRNLKRETSKNSTKLPNNSKRLKEVTVAHIKENFQKLGTPCERLSTTPEEEDEDSEQNMSFRYASHTGDTDWVIEAD